MSWSDDFLSREPEVVLVDAERKKIEKIEKENEIILANVDSLEKLLSSQSSAFGITDIFNIRVSFEKIKGIIEEEDDGFKMAIAAAKSCYSGDIVDLDFIKTAEDLENAQRIMNGTINARHHTPYMHKHYTFMMDNISRQIIWSLFHSHPFYNSEQVSQRYKRMEKRNITVPKFKSEKAQELFQQGIDLSFQVYDDLRDRILYPRTKEEYASRFKLSDSAIESRDSKDAQHHRNTIKKKTQEVSRYVIPVATMAHMWHTLNGITLARLYRLSNQPDCPREAKYVVGKMVDEVRKVDPKIIDKFNRPIPSEELLEAKVMKDFVNPHVHNELVKQFTKEFDAELGSKQSLLVDYKPNAIASMASSVREMLGIPSYAMSDADALRIVLDPAYNTQRGDILTLSHMQKLTRSQNIPNFTFLVKLSHTADSQAQRQRMSPATRGVFQMQVYDEPDYITPVLIKKAGEEASRVYQDTMEQLWNIRNKIIKEGESEELANMILPNATTIRYRESVDLLNFMQKDEKRECLNAQEEIWRIAIQQRLDVEKVHPELKGYFGPPCVLRHAAKQKPYCPEGDLYCGVPVWSGATGKADHLKVENMLDKRYI